MISRILINEYNLLANVGAVVVFRIFSATLTPYFLLHIEQLHCCCSSYARMFNCCAGRR